jgi:hypothetical protein
MAKNYLQVYRSLLEHPSVSDRDATAPLLRPVLEKEMN